MRLAPSRVLPFLYAIESLILRHVKHFVVLLCTADTVLRLSVPLDFANAPRYSVAFVSGLVSLSARLLYCLVCSLSCREP